MQQVPLQIVFFHRVKVRDPQRTHAGGGKVKGRRTAQTAGADYQDAGGGEPLLARNPDFIEEQVAAVTNQLGGRKRGGRIGHRSGKETRFVSDRK